MKYWINTWENKLCAEIPNFFEAVDWSEKSCNKINLVSEHFLYRELVQLRNWLREYSKKTKGKIRKSAYHRICYVKPTCFTYCLSEIPLRWSRENAILGIWNLNELLQEVVLEENVLIRVEWMKVKWFPHPWPHWTLLDWS